MSKKNKKKKRTALSLTDPKLCHWMLLKASLTISAMTCLSSLNNNTVRAAVLEISFWNLLTNQKSGFSQTLNEVMWMESWLFHYIQSSKSLITHNTNTHVHPFDRVFQGLPVLHSLTEFYQGFTCPISKLEDLLSYYLCTRSAIVIKMY